MHFFPPFFGKVIACHHLKASSQFLQEKNPSKPHHVSPLIAVVLSEGEETIYYFLQLREKKISSPVSSFLSLTPSSEGEIKKEKSPSSPCPASAAGGKYYPPPLPHTDCQKKKTKNTLKITFFLPLGRTCLLGWVCPDRYSRGDSFLVVFLA